MSRRDIKKASKQAMPDFAGITHHHAVISRSATTPGYCLRWLHRTPISRLLLSPRFGHFGHTSSSCFFSHFPTVERHRRRFFLHCLACSFIGHFYLPPTRLMLFAILELLRLKASLIVYYCWHEEHYFSRRHFPLFTSAMKRRAWRASTGCALAAAMPPAIF